MILKQDALFRKISQTQKHTLGQLTGVQTPAENDGGYSVFLLAHGTCEALVAPIKAVQSWSRTIASVVIQDPETVSPGCANHYVRAIHAMQWNGYTEWREKGERESERERERE